MDLDKFEVSEKLELVNVLNKTVFIDNSRSNVINAISRYTKSIFDAINDNDVSLIRFYRNEL